MLFRSLRTVSGEISCPASIPPFSEEKEKAIVTEILAELNNSFSLGLDPDPNFAHADSAPTMPSGNYRYNLVGGSHSKKIAASAAASTVWSARQGKVWLAPSRLAVIWKVGVSLTVMPCVDPIIPEGGRSYRLSQGPGPQAGPEWLASMEFRIRGVKGGGVGV